MFGITLLHPPENKKIKTRDYKYIYEIIELIITNHKLIVTTTMDKDDRAFHIDEESSSSSEDIPKTYEHFSVCDFVVDNDEKADDVPDLITSLSVNSTDKLKDLPEVDELLNDSAPNKEIVPEVDKLSNDIDGNTGNMQGLNVLFNNSDTNIISTVESISFSNVQSSTAVLPRTFSLLEKLIYWYKLLISTTRKFLSRFFKF